MKKDEIKRYRVVVNNEGQYSIWPTHRENALGWKDVDKEGSKEECLQYVDQMWTDLRPLSLQKEMAKVVVQKK